MKYLKTFEGLTTPTIEKIVSDIRDMCVELTDISFIINIARDGNNNEIDVRVTKGVHSFYAKGYKFEEIYEYMSMVIDYLKDYPCSISYRIDGTTYNEEEYSHYVRRRIDKNHTFHKSINDITVFMIEIKLEDETSK